MWDNIKTFLKNTRGSIAVPFALAVTLLLLVIGVAIDWSAMVTEQEHIQDYADAAVLAAVSSGETKKPELLKIAETVVASQTSKKMSVKLELIKGKEKGVKVTINSVYRPMIMGMFGYNGFDVTASAESPLGDGEKLNLALVLDTTLSMNGVRMDTLKSASSDLLNTLKNLAANPNDVKVSLVPFADYVKIDVANAGKKWLNVQPDHQITLRTLDEKNSVNCRQVGSGERIHTECDSYAYTEKPATLTWEGCMASRKNGFHKIAKYQLRQLQGPAGEVGCWSGYNELQPLSSKLYDVNASIQSLESYGLTYIPSGLIWGWRTLDRDLPFDEARATNAKDTQSVLLLMTDGSNTVSLNGERPGFEGLYHWGEHDENKAVRNANALTSELCQSIKADNIKVITVAFEVTDTTTLDLLRNCASSSSNFYIAKNSAGLKNAFGKIGSGFSNVRISR